MSGNGSLLASARIYWQPSGVAPFRDKRESVSFCAASSRDAWSRNKGSRLNGFIGGNWWVLTGNTGILGQ